MNGRKQTPEERLQEIKEAQCWCGHVFALCPRPDPYDCGWFPVFDSRHINIRERSVKE